MVVIGTTFIKMTTETENKSNYNIDIHLYNDETIHLEDIMGYNVHSEWVAISMKDGITHVFPGRDISYIKHFTKE